MFIMTFGICLFIVLMQFLWKYVEDLVGKGIDNMVLAEMFFYAGLNLIPLALPLAILLASLMTFGNLGETFELLAIKAAGVSLLKSMRPLIVFIVIVCIGAFFFQNNAVPIINVKFTSLLLSIKQKTPELDIPEGSFYSDIENYNLYVKSKDKKTNMLRDVMIYDVSKGFDNMTVIVCDSAKMKMASTKDHLLLSLYYGQQFANFRQSTAANPNSGYQSNKYIPYSRENFRQKDIIIPFNANFDRMDESTMDGTQISKNVSQLRTTIDSLKIVVDSMNIQDRKNIEYAYLSYRVNDRNSTEAEVMQTQHNDREFPAKLNFDSLLNSYSPEDQLNIYNMAISQAEANRNDHMFRSMAKFSAQKSMRAHLVQWHRKFTLSIACLIFFFIGAPLGAIIRKGGLGMPVVISVVLFIIYYVIDNVGNKMARDGVWEAWQGVWLSSIILFPLGVFLTYKAMNDSALFNIESYQLFIKKIETKFQKYKRPKLKK